MASQKPALRAAFREIESSVSDIAAQLAAVENTPSILVQESTHPLLPNSSRDLANEARKCLAEAALKLLQLATEPREYLERQAVHYQNLSCLRWLVNLKVLQHIPLSGCVAYASLAIRAGVPESQLKSVARMVIANDFLSEPSPGEICHNRNSAVLLKEPGFMDWALFMTNYSVPTAYRLTEATQRWGSTEAKHETAFNIACGVEEPFFDHLRQNTEFNARFSGYMRTVQATEGVSLTHLISGFDWGRLDDQAVVVDVGGSAGHSSCAIADKHRRLKFVVQDLPETLQNAQKPEEYKKQSSIASRVTYMPHDFFQAQPIQDADIYLLRMIIHDWPRDDAVRILGHLRDALRKPDARILIMDTVLPQPGSISLLQECQLRVRDLTMMEVFNAKERESEAWHQLMEDAGLEIYSVKQPQDSAMAILEVGRKEGTRCIPVPITNGQAHSADSTDIMTPLAEGGGFGEERPPILILGGGIGGLCLAQGLKKAGRDFKLFERDSQIASRPQGYRLKIDATGTRALKANLSASLFEKFTETCAYSVDGETDFNPMSGEITKSRSGGGLAGEQGLRAPHTVDRAAFRTVLMTGIEENIAFGKEFVSYQVFEQDCSVVASFKDGTHVKGRFIVGADGIRSVLRKRFLPGHQPIDTGAVCVYGKTPITSELTRRFPDKGLRWMTVCCDSAPLVQSILIRSSPLTLLCEPIRFNPKGRYRYSLPASYVYWVLIGRKEIFAANDKELAQLSSASPSGGIASAALSHRVTEEWSENIRSLFHLQDVEQCSTLRVASAVPNIAPWKSSRYVTLLGDAIHPMSPCGGVGANTALCDAADLAKTIAEARELTEAEVEGYEESMRKRALISLTRSFVGSQKMFDQRPFEECEKLDM